MSSASIPVVFPPQSLGSHVFMDGGTVWNLNLDSAVQQCLNKGFDASDIIADIAICGYNSIPEDALDVEKKAYVNWQQMNQVQGYYKNTDSIWEQASAYPGMDIRYYFQERNGCPDSMGGLDFNNSTTWCLQEAGRADAKAMLDIGSENIAKTFDEYQNDFSLRKQWPFFREYLEAVYNSFFSSGSGISQ